jgi:hypothetical protein
MTIGRNTGGVLADTSASVTTAAAMAIKSTADDLS